MGDYLFLIIGLAVLAVLVVTGLVVGGIRRSRRTPGPDARVEQAEPRVGDDAETPRDSPSSATASNQPRISLG